MIIFADEIIGYLDCVERIRDGWGKARLVPYLEVYTRNCKFIFRQEEKDYESIIATLREMFRQPIPIETTTNKYKGQHHPLIQKELEMYFFNIL